MTTETTTAAVSQPIQSAGEAELSPSAERGVDYIMAAIERFAEELADGRDRFGARVEAVNTLARIRRMLEDDARKLAALAVPAAPTVQSAALNGIPATMRHDEGAIARCAYCRRYTLDQNALGEDRYQPMCECGKKNGWSGSFEAPTANSRWNGAAPSPQVSQQAPSLTDADVIADPVLRHHFGLNGGAGPVSGKGWSIINAVLALSATAARKEG